MHLSCSLLALLSLGLAPQATLPKGEVYVTAMITVEELFPTPEEGLSIASTREGGPNLLNLLGEFSRITGQNLHVSEAARTRLRETPIGLLQNVEVPPREVYSFIEGLLWQSGFVMIDDRLAGPGLLAIKSTYGDERPSVDGLRNGCLTVAEQQLDAYKRHPALMIQTVIRMPSMPGGVNFGPALSSMSQHHNIWQIVVSGDTVILRGPARQVVQMAEILRAINAQRQVPKQNKEGSETNGR